MAGNHHPNVVVVDVSVQDLLVQRPHLPNTVEVFLSGQHVHQVSHSTVKVAFKDLPVDVTQISAVYRFMDARKYYVSFKDGCEAEVARIHGTVHAHPTLKLTLHIRDVNKSLVSGTLKWVPPTVKGSVLVKALANYAKDESIVLGSRKRDERDSIPFRFEKLDGVEIPHYIKLRIGEAYHHVKVQLPGRLPACSICYASGHAFYSCPSRSRQPPGRSSAPPPSISSSNANNRAWNQVVQNSEQDIVFVGSTRSNLQPQSTSPPPSPPSLVIASPTSTHSSSTGSPPSPTPNLHTYPPSLKPTPAVDTPETHERTTGSCNPSHLTPVSLFEAPYRQSPSSPPPTTKTSLQQQTLQPPVQIPLDKDQPSSTRSLPPLKSFLNPAQSSNTTTPNSASPTPIPTSADNPSPFVASRNLPRSPPTAKSCSRSGRLQKRNTPPTASTRTSHSTTPNNRRKRTDPPSGDIETERRRPGARPCPPK